MSVLVLLAAMNVTVKVLGWVGTERRGADRRQWAVQAASNVLERVAAGPFDRVTPDNVKAITARTDASRVLPGPAWEVEVDDEPGSPVPARRVSVRLRWKERSGEWGAPVRLSAWVFRRGAGS
jgi:hypothetical protein